MVARKGFEWLSKLQVELVRGLADRLLGSLNPDILLVVLGQVDRPQAVAKLLLRGACPLERLPQRMNDLPGEWEGPTAEISAGTVAQ